MTPVTPQPSVNGRAARIVDQIVADASALRCTISTGGAGERVIDLGANTPGGLEAGRRLGEVCMGGLGTVSLTTSSGHANWPLGVVVHSTNPVLACLASQYAGWTIQDEASGFFALGSGPARALSTSITTTRARSSSKATRHHRPWSSARLLRRAEFSLPA
jgi:methenyltetrahydromethanopterin cyclohydrolase